MPQHNPETLKMRAAVQQRIAHLPPREQRQFIEALREMHNEEASRVAEASRRASMPPAQPNAMSEAVSARYGSRVRKPVEQPFKAIKGKVTSDIRTRTKNIRRTSAPPMVQATERPIAGSYAIFDEAPSYTVFEGETPAAAARAAAGKAARGVVKALGKVAPVIGDLILPYASITGGEMYPQSEDGIYSSAVGGPLPPQYAAANEQEMQRRIPIENLAAQQAQARTQYGLEGPMQLNPVPLRTNIAASLPQQQRDPFVPLEMQQPQEPQSFAHQLATSNEPVEPESFAQRLSQEPAGEFEHYVKIYGSPERARQAMAQKYQAQQPNY